MLIASGTAAGRDRRRRLRGPVPKPPLPLLTPLLSVAPGQLLAWGLREASGLDPDRPNGLSKVTLARSTLLYHRRAGQLSIGPGERQNRLPTGIAIQILTLTGPVCKPPARGQLVCTNRERSTPRRVAMRIRLTAAAGVIALLALATASATGAKLAAPAAQATDITVWLMSDAQSNWPEAVAAANQSFRQQHPGVDVNVQYQSWGDYKTKFEATLAAGNSPDVIEFGNTDTPKYTAAGALAPPTRRTSPTRRPGSRVSPRRASTTAAPSPSRITPAPAASSTGPTSTRPPGSPRHRSRWPSSCPPATS